MNDAKLKKLFHAAQKEIAPEPSSAFSRTVVASIRRENQEPASLFDLLNQLFPKVAVASIIVIGVCFGSDLLLAEKDLSLSTDIVEVAEQWLFAAN